MPSSSVDRRLLGSILLSLIVASLQWLVVKAAPFYYPSNGFQVDPFYYAAPTQSANWAQPMSTGHYYSQPSNIIAPSSTQSDNADDYKARFNYYDVLGYEDYRTPQNNRYIWNDPYIRRQWKNYYQRYYYPSANHGGWDERRDGSEYYSRRRQDYVQSLDTTTPTTTVSIRPSVPRKKKLFVPNVWG